MDIAIDDLEVVHNPERHRFEIRYGNDLAQLQYRLREGAIVYVHTEVPPSLERHGIAGKLAKHGLDYARANGLRVVPLCPYVAAYIEQHPQYADLVE